MLVGTGKGCYSSVNFVFYSNENDSNTEKIADVNDSLLDRINLNLDTVNGENQPGGVVNNPVTISPWNLTPVIAKIKVRQHTETKLGTKALRQGHFYKLKARVLGKHWWLVDKMSF